MSTLAAAGYRVVAPFLRVLTATLGYYRAMLDATKGDPALAKLRALLERPIAVPTLALCGADDLRAELSRNVALPLSLIPAGGGRLRPALGRS